MTRADIAASWADEYAERVPARTLDMARLYVEEGWSYAEIGEKFGVSKQRVHQLLRPLGLERTFDRTTEERTNKAIDAHRRIVAGETTLEEAAAELGYASKHSLRTRLYSLGLRVQLPRELPPHGTPARYWHGCHCEKCREARAAYQRRRYHDLRATAKAREEKRVKAREQRAKRRREKEATE